MKYIRPLTVILLLCIVIVLVAYRKEFTELEPVQTVVQNVATTTDITVLAKLTNAEWKEKLTAGQYSVLREEGTETPFTSPLLKEKRSGTYVTADCGEPVFRSEQKFETGTGWPSFWAPIDAQAV
ncbi:MAG: peptide-methionine (R)-S-oxide reductase, partial [Patescibacteria group bacterium]